MLERKPFSHELQFSESVHGACLQNKELGLKLANCATELHELRQTCAKKQYDLLTYYEERDAGYKTGAAAWFAKSKQLLTKDDTPAGVALLAVKNLLGPAVMAWEPDTIWVELEDREGLDISLAMRDKILAAITLVEIPAFYWDVNTYMNTVMAFNDYASNVDRIHEPAPGELAWAAYEAELILHEHGQWEPEFDYEPKIYTAEILHRAGMVLAPQMLSFCQDVLDKRSCDGKKTCKEQVEKAWQLQSKGSLGNVKFPETPLGVQLAKLAAVEVYITERTDKYFSVFNELR